MNSILSDYNGKFVLGQIFVFGQVFRHEKIREPTNPFGNLKYFDYILSPPIFNTWDPPEVKKSNF